MSEYEFNWNWIDSITSTKKLSQAVKRSSSVVFDFRQAQNGSVSADSLNAFAISSSQSIQRLRNEWNTYIYPIIASLPAGGLDTRWSTTLGKGLRKEIDCFTYGMQGSTLFVFNDANSSKADGRYWHSDDLRPKTIAEAFEDLYQAISEISSSNTSTGTSATFEDVWAAIGVNYRDTLSYLSDHGSLDARTSVLEGYIRQIALDLYDNITYETIGGLGRPLTYSFAETLDALLQLHNVEGWGSDPSEVSHSDMSVAAHTHPFTDITPSPSPSLTANRLASNVTLLDEIKRLRYEIQAAKGSSNWYSDATYPTGITGTPSIHNHINKVGSGTASDTNPHAINYEDIGIDEYLDNIVSFTGMSDINDDSPSYSSTIYITQNSSLCTAVGDLDEAVAAAAAGAVIRVDYGPYDRSSMSATERAQTPITITHNKNKKPIIQVIDNTPETSDYYGIYSSPTYDVEINYPNANSVEVYTEAEVVEIIALF